MFNNFSTLKIKPEVFVSDCLSLYVRRAVYELAEMSRLS